MKNLKLLKRNFLPNGINSLSFYKFNRNFLYNRKEDMEEFEIRNKSLAEKFKDFEKNFQQFVELEKKNPNKKEQKPIRITYVDKANMKSKRDIVIDPITNQYTTVEKENTESTKLAGLDDKFPIENFIDLKSTQKGRTIHLQTYKYPSKDPNNIKGLVYLIHGMYEHSNSNAIIAKLLSEHGYEVLSFDFRGHGKSEGIRGFIENKDVLFEDINNFINITEAGYKDKTPNRFIIGYSLGGLFANLTCLHRPNYFSGMIQLAPAFYNDSNKYSFWIKVARLFNFIYPTLPLVHIKEKPNKKEIMEYLTNEPLLYKGKLRVGTGLTIIDAIKYSNDNIDKVTTPCYILHGSQDEILPSSSSSDFFNKIPVKDKTLILRDDLDHFIPRNEKINFFVNDIAFWMNVHSK